MTSPYREASRVAEDDALELPSLTGDRTRAVTPTDWERSGGVVRGLAVTRMLHCSECSAAGCVACEEQGYQLRTKSLDVRFTSPGNDVVVTLEGEGDTNAGGTAQGDVLVHVGSEAALAERVEAADLRLTELQKSWLEHRATTRRRRRLRRQTLFVLALVAVGIGAVAMLRYASKNADGDTCTRPQDCRSGVCDRSNRVAVCAPR